MKNFKCGNCNSKVFFENVLCLKCGKSLGFDPDALVIVSLESLGKDRPGYRNIADSTAPPVNYCSNAAHGACNWLSSDGGLCRACKLNRTIPNLAEPANVAAWRDLEQAKKRLLYSLMRFGLPFDQVGDGNQPLAFDFVRHAATGHLDGVVTIDVKETDAVERERQRQQFQEPYRSLLGHLRHESGHYFWPLLVEQRGYLDDFRALFGDEREDYGAALSRHHADGPPADWQSHHLTAYASVHPWEDWAETWAHYLHMVDAIDTAEAEGLEPRAAGMSWGARWPFRPSDAYRKARFSSLLKRWVPLTLALNNLSRSMGHDDFYPFVIPEPARDKLAFVHRLVTGR